MCVRQVICVWIAIANIWSEHKYLCCTCWLLQYLVFRAALHAPMLCVCVWSCYAYDENESVNIKCTKTIRFAKGNKVKSEMLKNLFYDVFELF